MGVVRRFRRRRTTRRDAIQQAWDRGLPPPGEAFLSQYKDLVIECFFFRAAEQPGMQEWAGPHHPHLESWYEALRSSRDE